MSTAPKTKIEVETAAHSELPEGWGLPTLADVCDINPPKPAADALPTDAPVSFVPMPALNADLGAITRAEIRPFSKVRKGFTAFANNDVIMAKITPCMENGKAALAQDLQNNLGFGSTEFHVLRSMGAALPQYIYHFIRQESFRRAAENEMTGSVGQKRVPADFLSNAEIPLPPLAEQERIISLLNETAVDTRSVRDKLGRVSVKLKNFRQAVLAAACLGRLTEDWRETHKQVEAGTQLLLRICGTKTAFAPDPEDVIELPDLPRTWQWARGETLCTPNRAITYGVIKLGAIVDGGVPTLRSSDVRWLRIEKGHIKCISRKIADNYYRTYLEGGEILVTVRGTLGGVAVVPHSMKGYNISREVAMLPVRDEFDAAFISYAIGSQRAQNWLTEAVKGVAYTGVNIRDLKRLPLPVPPTEEQREIVRRVEDLFKLADAIEKRVAAASVRADRLTQAILAKAFRGELVATEAELARREGREYEPASVLLERIKKEKTAVEGKTPRGNMDNRTIRKGPEAVTGT
jgi:type I restriction enzyme S subunit